jgi:hypothetical protein
MAKVEIFSFYFIWKIPPVTKCVCKRRVELLSRQRKGKCYIMREYGWPIYYSSTLAILAVSQGANCLKNHGGGKLEWVRKPERRNFTLR